jgi:predicted signal transduction protein with EAL and GGDEF domain
LRYRQAFAFDKIKIDQTFISRLDQNPQSQTIVKAVIGLARSIVARCWRKAWKPRTNSRSCGGKVVMKFKAI